MFLEAFEQLSTMGTVTQDGLLSIIFRETVRIRSAGWVNSTTCVV
jgi:hypothetical protein